MFKFLLLLALPLKHLEVTSAFGNRIHPVTGNYAYHEGVDLRANYDTVYAVLGGRLSAGCDPNLGVYLKLTNGPFCMIYGHLSQILEVDSVAAGEPIAISGATGRVTGPHLHFAVKLNGHYVDPLAFLLKLNH